MDKGRSGNAAGEIKRIYLLLDSDRVATRGLFSSPVLCLPGHDNNNQECDDDESAASPAGAAEEVKYRDSVAGRTELASYFTWHVLHPPTRSLNIGSPPQQEELTTNKYASHLEIRERVPSSAWGLRELFGNSLIP